MTEEWHQDPLILSKSPHAAFRHPHSVCGLHFTAFDMEERDASVDCWLTTESPPHVDLAYLGGLSFSLWEGVRFSALQWVFV
ncbi:hypothetical protein ACOMHN_048806 [Nucella lapillus]